MFTGIITDLGRVISVEQRGDVRLEIATTYNLDTIDIGASICCSGCCLTVVEKQSNSFSVDVSAESLSRTTLKNWKEGALVNLERSLKIGDELGGHLVSGHVDGVGEIIAIKLEGDSKRFTFRVPEELARFIATKGSIALDGTSLTVNEVSGSTFGANIIPHTQAVTTWGQARVGDPVNVEIDVLARYVARLVEFWKK